ASRLLCYDALYITTPPDPRARHASPTRRSSDLERHEPADAGLHGLRHEGVGRLRVRRSDEIDRGRPRHGRLPGGRSRPVEMHLRSEEHTSELQSREKLVCRLLLERTNV